MKVKLRLVSSRKVSINVPKLYGNAIGDFDGDFATQIRQRLRDILISCELNSILTLIWNPFKRHEQRACLRML